ncbi:MucR family transcriptional regulator [Sinorhizobium meliloti]|nr:MucR family transcriptional regulator [Sinorhizobium meliloti]
MSETTVRNDTLIQLTSDIVSSYVGNHNVSADGLPALIRSTYEALKSPLGTDASEPPKQEPKVPVHKSIDKKGEFIICLEDGKKFKSLKRHLAQAYGLTPAQYREKWGLPKDYPMVAPVYAKQRSELAKRTGLGRSNRRQAA